MQPFTAFEVCNMTKKLNNKLSVGEDQVPKSFVEKGSSFPYETLADLFNHTFQGSADVPADWLVSRGMNLHKSGDTTLLDNYRPIMLTCTLAKLYSALLNERLAFFAEAAKILSDNQQGARPNRSTSDNVFLAQQVRENAATRGSQCILVFLEFLKAFDRVNC